MFEDELREIVRLNADGTAWVNPLFPMSPKSRKGMQMLANYASALTLAHREMREKVQAAIAIDPMFTEDAAGDGGGRDA